MFRRFAKIINTNEYQVLCFHGFDKNKNKHMLHLVCNIDGQLNDMVFEYEDLEAVETAVNKINREILDTNYIPLIGKITDDKKQQN